ncbi:P-loop containing nucleoside triphosphate hydrolase protein [Melampsora americana]|nr:P-loop containing nucleoside triphosphate hydrolase protein [Melampsora americana]
MSLKTNTKAGSFGSLDPPLSQWIVDAVTAMGFSHMTPVQANTIPLFMQNKDVVAITGSGKTLSFVIPILEKVLAMERTEKKAIRAIVISPTRELATQIFEVFSSIIRCHPSSLEQDSEDTKNDSDGLRAMLLIGGTGARSIKKDMQDFRENGADVLIATPGRLEEFLVARHALVNLKALEMLVLDEADRLLDLGFAPVLTNVMSHLPKQRRTGLFSATLLNDGLTELIKVGLRNPVKIVVKVQTNKQLLVEDDRVPSGLINYFLEVPKIEWKTSQLIRLLNQMIIPKPRGDGAHKFIVYMSTCACVDYYYKILSKLSELENFAIYSLHAQQSPTRRSITYNSFKTSPLYKPTVLLCTDLVARGLDLPDIDVVIQYDPPKDVRNFFHRIGRTARAGRGGKAIVLLQRGRELDYIGRKPSTTPRITQPALADVDVDASALNSNIKTIVKTDRDLHDKAVNAFVSYVRFYSNHEASYIFQLKHLDLLQLGFEGFGLIRMPKMPELKDFQGKDGPLTPEGFKKEGHDFDVSK